MNMLWKRIWTLCPVHEEGVRTGQSLNIKEKKNPSIDDHITSA